MTPLPQRWQGLKSRCFMFLVMRLLNLLGFAGYDLLTAMRAFIDRAFDFDRFPDGHPIFDYQKPPILHFLALRFELAFQTEIRPLRSHVEQDEVQSFHGVVELLPA